MSPLTLLVAFFVFVVGAVTAAGYVFVLRPSRTEGESIHIPQALDLNLRDVPTAQATVLDMFRLIGEALPGNGKQAESARIMLVGAGYRWPAAVSIFMGIKWGSALLFATGAVWAAMLSYDNLAAIFLPAICGLGFGYMIPDRILERLARARADRLRRGLPAALDLMVSGSGGRSEPGCRHGGNQPRHAHHSSRSGLRIYAAPT